MYPRNAASPPRISIGPVVQISDGAVQTSGVTVSYIKEGGTETGSGGTIAYSTGGVVLYTPIQAETDATAIVFTAYKTGCIPATVTVVTTASATPGTVNDTSGTTTLLSRLTATRAGYLDQLEHIHDDTNNAASGVSTLLTRVGTPANLGTGGASLAGNLADIDAETDAIKAKTDTIPANPASTTNITAASGVALTAAYDAAKTAASATDLAVVDTVVDGIKAVTDKLDTIIKVV